MAHNMAVKEYISFDGGYSAQAQYQQPDRYRMLVDDDAGGYARIARGGGYSYAAASFGPDSVTQEMESFNRVLRFVPQEHLIEVEAGITLGELIGITMPQGLWLPVMPGYPGITVGGCIAANVHGKNPARNGAFINFVEEIALFHPANGVVRISRSENPFVFELTCGGYGLTGVILSATLRLEALPGSRLNKQRTTVGSLVEAARVLRELSDTSAFAYTFADAVPAARTFGRGFVYSGDFAPDPVFRKDAAETYQKMTSEKRAFLPVSAWQGGLISRVFNTVYWNMEAMTPARHQISLFASLFPFAKKTIYFYLFGRRGLVEYQTLVPFDQAEGFLQELQRLILKNKPPALMMSLKAFRGRQKYLRFERDGICTTINLIRSASALEFLPLLDEVVLAAGGIPHIIKDSRLPVDIVRKSYPEYDAFRQALHEYDPARLYRSELSQRLGL